MRSHRFFVDGVTLAVDTETAVTDESVVHQWKDVFRLRSGDEVVLLDGSGSEFRARITLLSKDDTRVVVLDQRDVPVKAVCDIRLFAAIVKKDTYEWIVEKGTELGVSGFVPVVSERSEKKDVNPERLRKIMREASEQSGRGTLPALGNVADLEDALDAAEADGVSLVAFHLEGSAFNSAVRDALRAAGKPVGVLIGPEGGWSDREINLFTERRIPIYSLQTNVLRAETAAVVIPSLILIR